MALIPCPECAREVSSRAPTCPSCGCPIANEDSATAPAPQIPRPDLAADLDIGGQVVNWTGSAAIKGHYDTQENSLAGIPDGNVNLLLHKRGIQLTGMLYMPLLTVHFSQIIDIKYVPRSVIYNEDKSVVKRAVVGGLILGPLGAIIGGMSGVGSKQKEKFTGYTIVNFWDPELDQPASLLVAVNDENGAKRFIEKVSKSL